MNIKINRIEGGDGPFEIVWDKLGIPHVFATSVADAYRGMGYAAGYERLWQIHLSCAYANGEAAALLGERFVQQDAFQRAFNVHGGQTGLTESKGDWIADAYLEGLNAYVLSLEEIPPEFLHAEVEPRLFTRMDIAARYRFTSWFQHKSWTEKMVLGRLMATHGVDYFSNHVLHFSDEDRALINDLKEPLRNLDPKMIQLAYPEVNVPSFSGSNNWAITGKLSSSGKPILATDPHQPHSLPNTFFYVHLNAGSWDAFGAAFPGVPYFMMGFTPDIAWGLTTGFVDCYDLFVEEVKDDQYRTQSGWKDLDTQEEIIEVKGQSDSSISIQKTHHGVLLEPFMNEFGMSGSQKNQYQTSLYWSLQNVPTSAGALALLPTAKSAKEFGEFLFENDVCPLVNNIICVDKDSQLERYIATTTPVRKGVTGSVPLPGWIDKYDFNLAMPDQLLVEKNPISGFSLTANNDTMGEEGEFYIHNFPTHNSRANRIRDILSQKKNFSVKDFCAMQLDLHDLRSVDILPDLIKVLEESEDEEVILAARLLGEWDNSASVDSIGACLYYPFLDRFWQRKFMNEILEDDLISLLPMAAPGLNRFDIGSFLSPETPWVDHEELLKTIIQNEMRTVVDRVKLSLGNDCSKWRWGNLHKIAFRHRLNKHKPWNKLKIGPDEIGGSSTTLGMAVHAGKGPGTINEDEVPCRVFHGPAYRLVIDLADPFHSKFVIAGGNSGRHDSDFSMNQYKAWLNGDFYTLNLKREEIDEHLIWEFD
ncbi:MAG TPA: penicillin acylase family protein [Gammaproteobacteria bacterium]|jgi:penicillin amidase|nr:penicillin acylase family protein [Gammaproteobacteria bacterium]